MLANIFLKTTFLAFSDYVLAFYLGVGAELCR